MKDDSPQSGCIMPPPKTSVKSEKDFQQKNSIDILVRDAKWQTKTCFDPLSLITQILDAVLKHTLNTASWFNLSVLLTGDAEIQDLNKQYRHKDKPTNVLSFESGDFLGEPLKNKPQGNADSSRPLTPLGDIVLSYGTLEREAIEQEKVFQDHFIHLFIHGLLHLLGFDHQENENAETMEALEVEILKREFQINNPYNIKR